MASFRDAAVRILALALALALIASVIYAQSEIPIPNGYQEEFSGGPLTIYRGVQMVSNAVIVYSVPGVAMLDSEFEISYLVRNDGFETARDIYLEQDVPGGVGYRLAVGSLEPGAEAMVSLRHRQKADALPAPEASYALPPAEVQTPDGAMAGERAELWLSASGEALVLQDFEVVAPSGTGQWLRTDELGYAAFVPREEGAHRIVVAGREASPASAIDVSPRPEEVGFDNYMHNDKVSTPASSAFLAGGITGALGSLDWPVVFAILVNLLLLAGLVRYAMRMPPHDAMENVPHELKEYRSHPASPEGDAKAEEKSEQAVAPETAPQPKQLTEEEKQRLMDSTVSLTPRQIWKIENEERHAEQPPHPKPHRRTRHNAG